MNETKRRTEITIETREITVIRTVGGQRTDYCENCLKNVSAFAPKRIADVLRLSVTEICRRVETKQIHLIDSGRGTALICGDSLGSGKDI